MSVQAVVAQIEALAIDPPGARLTFVARLARENGWSTAHARAVDREYRRFLALAVTAGHPVTPSDAVDQAWHLHLSYTRSYWDDLCGTILGRPLHHGPTQGGSAEAARYRRHYADTLASYRRLFGLSPPIAIWPPVEERFAGRFERVDRTTHWRVPKRAATLAAGVPLAGCALIANSGFIGSDALFWILAMVIVAVVLTRPKNRRRDRSGGDAEFDVSDGGDSGCGGGCGGGD